MDQKSLLELIYVIIFAFLKMVFFKRNNEYKTAMKRKNLKIILQKYMVR